MPKKGDHNKSNKLSTRRSRMRTIAFLCTALMAQSVMAQGMGALPPGDVTVVNDENSPVPVTEQTIVEYRYVGLTQAEFDGDDAGGVGGLNASCESKFGGGARLATSSEAEARTDGFADPREGWVLPTPPITVGPDPFEGFRAYDALGQVAGGIGSANEDLALTSAACGRFHLGTENEQGMAVGPSGLLKLDDCDEVQPAACSAPIAIPVLAD